MGSEWTGLCDVNGVRIHVGDTVENYAFIDTVVKDNGIYTTSRSYRDPETGMKQPLSIHDGIKVIKHEE